MNCTPASRSIDAHQLVGEPIVGREWLLQNHAGDFPMPRGGVLPGGTFLHFSVAALVGRDSVELPGESYRLDGSRPQAKHLGKPNESRFGSAQLRHLLHNMPECVSSLVTVLLRISRATDADAVENEN